MSSTLDLHGTLLCASGDAYGIDGTTGKYDSNNFYHSYVGWKSLPTVITGTSSIAPIGKINACLVGLAEVGIIVAFRGTLFSEVEGIEDWLQDLDVAPVAAPPLPGLVHQGFDDAVQSLFAQVKTTVQGLLKNSTSTPLYITGHSKGGGMAPLAAYLLEGIQPTQPIEPPIRVTEVVTFAAPKSGDVGFQASYNGIFGTKHTRYECYGDFAPFVWPTAADGLIGDLVALLDEYPDLKWLANMIEPAASWDYQPVGNELYIAYIGGKYQVTTSNATQTGDLIFNLAEGLYEGESLEQILLDAHTISCGFGYMDGVCPSISCPLAPEGSRPHATDIADTPPKSA